MIHLAPRSTRTDYLLPYTTHFRSPHRRQTPSAPRDHTPRPCRRAAEYQWMSYGSSPVCCGSPRQGHDSASSSNRLETWWRFHRSEEHTSELQSLIRNSYAVFCLKKKKDTEIKNDHYSYQTYN